MKRGTFKQAIAAHQECAPRLMQLPGVVGVGIAETTTGQPCIQVYLRSNDQNTQCKLPKRVHGLQVVTEAVGNTVAR